MLYLAKSSRLITPLRLAAVAILVVLAGCATPYRTSPTPTSAPPESVPSPSTVETQPAVPPETAPPETLPPPPVRSRGLSPASRALVTQAQTQSNAGNDALAASTIERALRIEADNPLLWIELAKIRHNQGNEPQAENLARKALSMAVGDPKTQSAAWRVIANSYRARGRNVEAREADLKAAGLGG